MQKGEKSVGAIWKSKSKSGMDYFSIQLELNGEKMKFVAFPNNYKENDNHPDFKMYASEQPTGQSSYKSNAPAARPQRPVSRPATKSANDNLEIEDTNDIPF